MGMSDRIEAFILELMKQEQEDWLRIQRNELAQIFGCVPSQINYVISTRFKPERGYVVESRRGGGGCVMIRRIPRGTYTNIDASETEHIISGLSELYNLNDISAAIMRAALSDNALISVDDRNKVRADIINSIINVLQD